MSRVVIRPLHKDDEGEWRRLWTAYLAFYESVLPEEIFASTFARLTGEAAEGEYRGLLATLDGKPVGLAHYLFHRSCWTVGNVCYLQDLFTSAAARGKGVGRALINGVYDQAKLAGGSRVYWQTHETNHTAMQLYNKVAERSGFVVYRQTL